MSWLKRMNLAIDYIEENLTNGVSIDDVAAVACCSKFHFHRVFYSCFNLTFSEYIRLRKFTLAAADLVNGQDSIMNIALRYGYNSPNAFTRAFRKCHGVNLGEVRTGQVRLTTYHRVAFPTETIGVEKMQYKIVEKPGFNLLGKSKKFDFEDFAKNGPKFWKDYVASEEYKSLCQLSNGKPGVVSGAPLITAYFPKEKEKQGEFVDVLGIEISTDSASQSFECHNVPAATYAEFECTYRGSMKTNRYIYKNWFAATGYERDGDKPDIVAYFPMPFRHFSEMAIRWWIPVIKL